VRRDLTVTSEGQTRHKPAEKAELPVATRYTSFVRLAPSVASEELARRSPAEKAELAAANEHFSVGLQQRQIERSSSE